MITPTNIIVISGLLNNSGITVSPLFESTVNTFTTRNISGVIQSVFARYDTVPPDILAAFSLAPSCITGIDPNNHSITNLPKAIYNRAISYFKTADTGDVLQVAAFINVFYQVYSYVSEVSQIIAAKKNFQSKEFSDLGFQYNNYEDLISGGVTSQFDKNKLPQLAAELKNLGTLFDATDLSRLDDPGAMIQNLIDQGLGSVGNLAGQISASGVDITAPVDDVKCNYENTLASIKDADMAEIMAVTNFRPAQPDKIKSLNDVFVLENVFSPEALSALGENKTMSDLARKLSNVGGKFSSFDQVSNFYSSLNLSSSPLLKDLKTLLPEDLIGSIDTLGTGSGPNNTIKLLDMLGTAAGYKYIDNLTEVVNIQSQLLNETEILDLIEYLDSTNPVIPGAPELDATELGTFIAAINNKATITNQIQLGEQKMSECSLLLAKEVDLMTSADIKVGSSAVSRSGLISFANNLPNYAVDRLNLGIYDLLKNLVAGDIYGEAINSALLEAQNLSVMASVGIKTGTKVDTIALLKVT